MAPTQPTDEETDDLHYADRRNFYKEKWSRDALRIEPILFAGNSLHSSLGRGAEARRRAVSDSVPG